LGLSLLLNAELTTVSAIIGYLVHEQGRIERIIGMIRTDKPVTKKE
jgi:hypothetical protein